MRHQEVNTTLNRAVTQTLHYSKQRAVWNDFSVSLSYNAMFFHVETWSPEPRVHVKIESESVKKPT